jgi:hypothetical protein
LKNRKVIVVGSRVVGIKRSGRHGGVAEMQGV